MTAVATLVPPRLAEIQARFTPSAVRSSDATSNGATPSITTSAFAATLSDLLSGSSTSGTGSADPAIDLSSLTSVLASSIDTRRNSPLGDNSRLTSTGAPTGDDAVTAAKQYLGVDYVWGGTDPAKGLDCSGLVQRAYRDLGVELPRVSYDQAKAGTKVDSIDQARPGDLVAFGSPVDHIAIYVGDGKIIQAPRTGDVVRITDIKRPIAAIRRIIPESATGVGAGTAATSTGTTGIAGAERYELLFQQAGERYGLNPRLLAAVAKTESNFDPAARSGVGAVGLMQFMPATAAGMGIDPTDPAQAIDGGARYLRTQLDRFGSIDLALAAYNAGPGAVQRAGGVPPYTETRNYVTKVLGLMAGQSATATTTTTGISSLTTSATTPTQNGVLS